MIGTFSKKKDLALPEQDHDICLKMTLKRNDLLISIFGIKK